MNIGMEDRLFLEHHKIPTRFVFDASGIRAKDYESIMGDLGLIVAIGVSSCGKCGRSLKTRHAQCLVCHPACLGFKKRAGKRAYVYVAGSLKGKVLKVGYTEDYTARILKLNENSYGGINDWGLLYKGKYDNALNVENYVHQQLKLYNDNLEYIYYGKDSISNEIFRCDHNVIRRIIDEMNDSKYKVSEEYYVINAGINYNFGYNT